MNYEEFRTALLNVSTSFDCQCYLSVVKSPTVLFHHKYPLLIDNEGIWCPALKEFNGYTWDELEVMVDNNDWENWQEDNKTIMRIYDNQYIITLYKVQSLDELI